MWKQTISALRLLILLTILTGVLYPLAMTGIAQAVFPAQANQKLIDGVKENLDKVRSENQLGEDAVMPSDLVLASARGLDPDISPEGAYLQVKRVARERHLSEITVRELATSQVQMKTLGLLGEQRVNVLSLNMALDQLAKK